ncbi:hypothetical protein BCD67_12985 [Oscillatoriales cyanobacterium USR001]|nr:hypothetical protein BCD67_12985 [Oscillatoriales cyanobacterium USR001]
MNSTSEKSSTSPSFLSAQTLVILGIVWAVLALLFFLLFSVPPDGEVLPLWYSIGTYIFECVAYLGAALVCFRNWKSPQMVSGRNVWLGLGLGMLFYFLANIIFGVWELYFELDPDISPADAFYIGSYIVLIWGMILAVTSKRLNLEVWQWGLLGGIAAIGMAIAFWVAAPDFLKAQFGLASAPAPTTVESPAPAAGKAALQAPAIKSEAAAEKSETPEAAEEEEEEVSSRVPSWVMSLDVLLTPYAYGVNLFYIIGDVFLLIIATALLLAFWGGRFSQSWRMIAAATFSLYVADMYSKWRDTQPESSFQSGSLLEVFFVFSAILFGVGAVLEHDISSRSRQSRRGRRGA